MLRQISVFLENKAGRLAEVTRVLGENNVDLNALSIADTTDFGILRLIAEPTEAAEQALRAAGFMVNVTNVIGISIDDTPGALVKALDTLQQLQIDVEYIYAFEGRAHNTAIGIFKVAGDPELAETALKAAGVTLL